MKTPNYNPSPLEVQFAEIIAGLKDQIEEQLKGNKILEIKEETQLDNPQLNFVLQDEDGDQHEVVVKLIQRIDEID